MKKHLTAVISGRVQGVYYRYFAVVTANSLGVCGWVKNMPSGSVRVEAEASPEVLNIFVEQLKKGPSSADVEKVEVSISDNLENFKDFKVR